MQVSKWCIFNRQLQLWILSVTIFLQSHDSRKWPQSVIGLPVLHAYRNMRFNYKPGTSTVGNTRSQLGWQRISKSVSVRLSSSRILMRFWAKCTVSWRPLDEHELKNVLTDTGSRENVIRSWTHCAIGWLSWIFELSHEKSLQIIELCFYDQFSLFSFALFRYQVNLHFWQLSVIITTLRSPSQGLQSIEILKHYLL